LQKTRNTERDAKRDGTYTERYEKRDGQTHRKKYAKRLTDRKKFAESETETQRERDAKRKRHTYTERKIMQTL
jgi:hypothetical protein